MLELTFYAVLHKDPTSDLGVHFPDVPGCFSAGSTLREAASMAQEALEEHLSWLLEDGDPIPTSSSKEQILRGVDKEGFVRVLPVKVVLPTPPSSGGTARSSVGPLPALL